MGAKRFILAKGIGGVTRIFHSIIPKIDRYFNSEHAFDSVMRVPVRLRRHGTEHPPRFLSGALRIRHHGRPAGRPFQGDGLLSEFFSYRRHTALLL